VKETIKKLTVDFAALTFAMLTIVFFWKNTALTSILLVIISIVLLIKASKIDRLFFAIISISATVIESLTISSGAWIYSTQHIFIVPLWIPLYWGIGGTVMKDIYLFLKEKIVK
jgi:hypothetical protein